MKFNKTKLYLKLIGWSLAIAGSYFGFETEYELLAWSMALTGVVLVTISIVFLKW